MRSKYKKQWNDVNPKKSYDYKTIYNKIIVINLHTKNPSIYKLITGIHYINNQNKIQ